MYTETVFQSSKNNKRFTDILKEKDIVIGIKVDQGLGNIPGTKDETYTKGIDVLADFCKKHYNEGCRFAKWRSVLKISDNLPSEAAIEENAHGLARYAAICQENGLVPIVEPEILQDGNHSIERCAEVSEIVFNRVQQKLIQFGVLLEGMLLKPNMVTSGSECPNKADHETVAH